MFYNQIIVREQDNDDYFGKLILVDLAVNISLNIQNRDQNGLKKLKAMIDKEELKELKSINPYLR